MEHGTFLDFLHTAEKLKCNTRHSWTSSGRQESVAEHSWRLALMALLCKNEYPEIDIQKVITMSLIHDLGEAITGDIPAFLKSNADESKESKAIEMILSVLPQAEQQEFRTLFTEMDQMQTMEAKLWKALDNMEALISHNEAPLNTWLPIEFTANLTYGDENCAWSPWTAELKRLICNDSMRKIQDEST
ncbi:MAG: HD domain-containing protein [Clostridia bacterium]|nr:HD domain-containing protein [Clostridia bacterium]